MEMIKNNPLYTVLIRAEKFLSKNADELLAEFLEQVHKLP